MRQFVEGGLYLPEFQDPKQEAAVEALGLKSLVKILGSRNPSQALYLSYWSRKATNDKTNAKRS